MSYIDPEELPDEPDWGNVPALCPHDKPAEECQDCAHLADLAYDAMRESTRFS